MGGETAAGTEGIIAAQRGTVGVAAEVRKNPTAGAVAAMGIAEGVRSAVAADRAFEKKGLAPIGHRTAAVGRGERVRMRTERGIAGKCTRIHRDAARGDAAAVGAL